MTTPNTITVPAFPRIADLVGPWAIEPEAGRRLAEMVRNTDWTTHAAAGRGERSPAGGSSAKGIAVVDIVGTMLKHETSYGGTSTVRTRRDIRNAAADPTVSAIVLRIDSPGGTVAGTDDLGAEIRAARQAKPVVAFLEDMGASAAYWIASQAEAIYANSDTALVGSIGTLMTVYDVSAAAAKEGVKAIVFATGDLKGAGAPGTVITVEQQAYFQRLVDSGQRSFDAAVLSGRRLSAAQLSKVKTGAVFSAREALQLGLIDGIQTFETTLRGLAGRSGDARQASTVTRTIMEPTIPTIDAEAIRQEERARLAEIDNYTRGLNLSGPSLNRVNELRAQAIAGTISIDALKTGVLAEMKANLGPSTISSVGASYNFGNGGRLNLVSGQNYATSKDHLTAAILHKIGRGELAAKKLGADVAEQSRHLGRRGFFEMFQTALMMDGHTVPADHNAVLRMASVSTGSLPIALSGSMDIVLAQMYEAEQVTWRSFCAIRSAKDFREKTELRSSVYGDLEKLAPSGAIKHATYGENAEFTWKIETYAKMLGIDRQTIFNDDLGVFDQVIPQFGRMAMRSLSTLIYKTLLANAGPFFSVGNANLQSGGGSALSLTSLGLAVQKMRVQKDADGNTLDITPETLVVPPELEITARALLNSLLLNRDGTDDNQPTGNPLQGVAKLEVEGRLSNTSISGNSTTAWHLFANPSRAPMVVAFLEGKETPTTEFHGLDSDVNTLNLHWRIYHDYGCALGDYKAAQKSAGA